MFITLTIDTTRKNKRTIRVQRSKINPAKGWRRAINIKKRSLWQKFKDYRRSLAKGVYRLGGQIAMF